MIGFGFGYHPSTKSNPSSLASLKLWLDANRGTDVATDGSGVGSWTDQSGVCAPFVQATAGKKPILKKNQVHGWPGIQFTASNAQILVSSSTMTTTGTGAADIIWVVASVISVSTDSANSYENVSLSHCDAGAGGYRGVYLRSSLKALSYAFDGADKHADATFALNTLSLFRARHVAGTLYMRVNSGAEVSAPGGTCAGLTNAFQIGQGETGPYFNGMIHENIMALSATAAELTMMDRYFASKYGLSL